MIPIAPYEDLAEHSRAIKQAAKLEWITIGFLGTVILLMFTVMSGSQAMFTALVEDALSLIPPISFLIGSKVARRAPDEQFPYGYHRAITIAFFASSLALLAFGLILAGDALRVLVARQHPTIGAVSLFGETVWMGWLMLPVLLWSIVPALVLGHKKLHLARKLHDKVLLADAKMNKADWLSGTAAICGVIGIWLGYWWADAAAALIISIDITRDGFVNVRAVVGDLMDRRPQTVERKEWTEVQEQLLKRARSAPWVKGAAVRLREHGHIILGEIFLMTSDDQVTAQQVEELGEKLRQTNHFVHDLTISLWPEDRSGFH